MMDPLGTVVFAIFAILMLVAIVAPQMGKKSDKE